MRQVVLRPDGQVVDPDEVNQVNNGYEQPAADLTRPDDADGDGEQQAAQERIGPVESPAVDAGADAVDEHQHNE